MLAFCALVAAGWEAMLAEGACGVYTGVTSVGFGKSTLVGVLDAMS